MRRNNCGEQEWKVSDEFGVCINKLETIDEKKERLESLKKKYPESKIKARWDGYNWDFSSIEEESEEAEEQIWNFDKEDLKRWNNDLKKSIEKLESEIKEIEKKELILENTTPHDIVLICGEVNVVFKKSEIPVRLSEEQEKISEINGVPIYRKKYGSANLPEKKEGVFYLVSALVAQAYPNRNDFLMVNDTVRDSCGKIIGCKSFSVI